jgi:NAD(P)H-dependent FMN reductase
MTKIKVIAGSVRPGRFNIQPATWITELASKYKDLDVELIDLQELNLPFYNEPQSPLTGNYVHEHTKEWAKVVDEADGFIWVTPEYNHSYSPVLKNAIDYLGKEWSGKPVSLVSYGAAAGGSRAAEHLRGVAGQLRMFDLREQVILPHYYTNLDEKGNFKFSENEENMAHALIEELATWAQKLKVARTADEPATV